MKMLKGSFLFLAVITLLLFNNCNRFETAPDLTGSITNQSTQNSTIDNQPSNNFPDGATPAPAPQPQQPQPQPFPVPNGKIWVNEPGGLAVKVDCPFDDIASCNLDDSYSTATIQMDNTAPASPSKVLRSRIEANSETGGVQLVYALGDIYRELYVGMMWRTNAGFVTNPTVANKMWFMRGPETNGFFGLNLGIGSNTGTIGFGHNTGGLDNSHTCAADLGLICEPKAGNSPVTVGKWALLEAYIKASSTATSRDGIVRWWVNGVMVGNYQNMNYPGGMDEWIWTETWANKAVNLPVAREHYLDHLKISARK